MFPNPLLSKYVKPRIITAFSTAFPNYSLRIANIRYDVVQNRFDIDTVIVSTINGYTVGRISSFSVDGIRLDKMLWKGTIDADAFKSVTIEANEINHSFPGGEYHFRCGRMTVSVPDSEIVLESLHIQPNGDDEQFFARKTFRQTRYRVSVPYGKIEGCSVLQLLLGNKFIIGTIRIHRPFFDILVNKDKNDKKQTSPYQMPNEILGSVTEQVNVGIVRITKMGLKYGERFAIRSKPAVITFDSLNATIEGIANHSNGASAVMIRAEGSFMKAGAMTIHMSILKSLSEFSLSYSGTLGRMNVRALNGFLETAERVRVSGDIQSAKFDVNVVSGYARGSVKVIYNDLSLSFINKHSGSDKGVMNLISSFIANTFKIRADNLPDKKGNIKIGVVNYSRTSDDPFFRFAWFALRSGVKDVAGF